MTGRDGVVALGEAMLRMNAPPGQRLSGARTLAVNVAGAEANVAAALASLGVRATWVSALPDSPLGHGVADELAAAGVCIDAVTFMPDTRLGLFFVEHGVPPRPTRVWYDRADSAFSRLETFPHVLLADARFAVVSGITPGLGERSRAVALDFAHAARAAGAELCVDVNYRQLLWPADIAAPAIGELLALADIAVCSERDARLIFGLHGTEHEVIDGLALRHAAAARLVLLTRSEHGSLLRERSGEISIQPAFSTTVVDAFGAGDACVAGFLWALAAGRSPCAAQRAGAALAALNCTVTGDFARFHPAEIDALGGEPEAALIR